MADKKATADKKDTADKKATADKNKHKPDTKYRDESYFAAGRRKRKRYMKIIVPAIIGVVAVAIISAIAFSLQPSSSNENYGPVGSAHEHAAFLVMLDRVPINFSQSQYQVKSNLIHVENGDGTTLHRHATGVPFIEFLKSVDMDIQDGCFVADDGREYCDTADKKLRYFVNGNETSSIANYVPKENDRILVDYSDENEDELKREIDVLRQIPIRR
jgi:hypothetical protein